MKKLAKNMNELYKLEYKTSEKCKIMLLIHQESKDNDKSCDTTCGLVVWVERRRSVIVEQYQ